MKEIDDARIKVNMQASKEKAPDATVMQLSLKGSTMSSSTSGYASVTVDSLNSPLAVSGHSPTNTISTATSATGSPTTIGQISESDSLKNQ